MNPGTLNQGEQGEEIIETEGEARPDSETGSQSLVPSDSQSLASPPDGSDGDSKADDDEDSDDEDEDEDDDIPEVATEAILTYVSTGGVDYRLGCPIPSTVEHSQFRRDWEEEVPKLDDKEKPIMRDGKAVKVKVKKWTDPGRLPFDVFYIHKYPRSQEKGGTLFRIFCNPGPGSNMEKKHTFALIEETTSPPSRTIHLMGEEAFVRLMLVTNSRYLAMRNGWSDDQLMAVLKAESERTEAENKKLEKSAMAKARSSKAKRSTKSKGKVTEDVEVQGGRSQEREAQDGRAYHQLVTRISSNVYEWFRELCRTEQKRPFLVVQEALRLRKILNPRDETLEDLSDFARARKMSPDEFLVFLLDQHRSHVQGADGIFDVLKHAAWTKPMQEKKKGRHG